MGNNIRLVRASLCSNPWLMARIAFYGTGLGTKCDAHLQRCVVMVLVPSIGMPCCAPRKYTSHDNHARLVQALNVFHDQRQDQHG